MKSAGLKRTLFILLILALVIGLDQGTKTLARHYFEYYDYKTYLHRLFTLTRVENSGAFLSLGDNLSGPLRAVLLNLLPVIAVLFGLYYVFKKTDLERVPLIGIILIIGGGAGNIYDRLVYGSVTDFMQIDFILFKTGIFNVADMCIMAGTFMIVLHAWFKRKPEEGEIKTEIPNE